MGAPLTTFLDQRAHVARELVARVLRDPARLRGEVVAAHVGRDDAKTRRRKRGDLMPPAVPELRKAMQKDHERPMTSFYIVQANVA